MTKLIIPEAALQQHVAVLGKTGSGKTSTAKLAVEQVVPAGARVCILDPIKSDWWGLISSADGKKPGLPFHILGGPRGHVPLHASAGKAIAEVVASGALRHSIIDMADFEPGGLQRFFIDFAPTLLRKMRGVLYLVIEEAHEFAPKERSGIGQENVAVHWAKKLATAGRSKGIRLILATQRTQALHNALLGSCDTMIVHRLTAPADQKPVLDWLKANTTAGVQEMVSAQLASLRTGSAWFCSGEAKIFERMDFPRIRTFDNSATPTGDGEDQNVATAPVDADNLKAIVGEAVKEAEANDPRVLRDKLAAAQRELAKMRNSANSPAAPVVDPKAMEEAEKRGRARGWAAAMEQLVAPLARLDTLSKALVDQVESLHDDAKRMVGQQPRPSLPVSPPAPVREKRTPTDGTGTGAVDKAMPRAFLTALAQHPDGLTKGQILIHTGYRSSGPVSGCFAEMARNGWVTAARGGRMVVTHAGLEALGSYDPLPTGAALRQHLLNGSKCSGMEKAMLKALFESYPEPMAKGDILQVTGYASSGPTSGAFARLVALGYAEKVDRGHLRAAEELFNG